MVYGHAGLREFGETFASSLTGQRSLTAAAGANVQGPQPGVVTIIDLDGVAKGQVIIFEYPPPPFKHIESLKYLKNTNNHNDDNNNNNNKIC